MRRAHPRRGPRWRPLIDATDEDWDTEYLGLDHGGPGRSTRSTRPIDHVNRYGTGHSEAIVTETAARRRPSPAAWTPACGLRERLDPLHRRRRVRHGRRDGQLDPEAARARPDRAARADHLQVRRPRHGPGPPVGRPSPAHQDGTLRLGILGGAFNPPHLGHLVLAQEGYWQLGLDRVVLMPAGQPPHKEIEHDPGRERALPDVLTWPAWERSGLARRAPRSTATARRTPSTRCGSWRRAPGPIVLLLGADRRRSLPAMARARRDPQDWRTLAVAERDGQGGRGGADAPSWRLAGAERVKFFDMPSIEVSSTVVRERVAARRPYRFLRARASRRPDRGARPVPGRRLKAGVESPRPPRPSRAASRRSRWTRRRTTWSCSTCADVVAYTDFLVIAHRQHGAPDAGDRGRDLPRPEARRRGEEGALPSGWRASRRRAGS